MADKQEVDLIELEDAEIEDEEFRLLEARLKLSKFDIGLVNEIAQAARDD